MHTQNRVARHRATLFGGLTIIFAIAAVVWTIAAASALSPTYDEPHHLATGIEWWQFGTYRWWTENPPLPKAVSALGPYLAGMRLPGSVASLGRFPWIAGLQLLEEGGASPRALMLARLGTLSFLLLTLGLTFVLAGGCRQSLRAFLATALVATYPPLLGHAGFITTDVAAAATTLLFLFALDRWADQPSRGGAGALGAAFALALLCKLTAPLTCSVLGLAWLGGRRLARGGWWVADGLRWRQLLGHAALAGLSAFLVVWAGYRFSTGSLDEIPRQEYIGTLLLPPMAQGSALLAWLCRLRLPAPELWHGLLFLRAHSAHGHTAYLFGQISDHGFWNFYLVGLSLKSPLPFLLMLVAATPALFLRGVRQAVGGRGLGAGLAALAMLALSMVLTVNIGLRHVLVVVPLLAIFIAGVLASWLTSLAPRHQVIAGLALALLLGANVAIVEAARPQLMAYFNPLAGREPGHVLIDSDLDWGQDLLLLEAELRARHVTSAHYGFFGAMNPCGADVPSLLPLLPRTPVTGWIVLSEEFYRSNYFVGFRRDPCGSPSHYSFNLAPADSFDWLKPLQPVARVGASLRLYYIPVAQAASGTSPRAEDQEWREQHPFVGK